MSTRIQPITEAGKDHLTFDVQVDGESVGRFETLEEAQRGLHHFLQGIPVIAAHNLKFSLDKS